MTIVDRPDRFDHLDPVQPRQRVVDECQIEVDRGHLLHDFLGIAVRNRLAGLGPLDQLTKERHGGGVVFQDENAHGDSGGIARRASTCRFKSPTDSERFC
jgi:hypothetical protein